MTDVPCVCCCYVVDQDGTKRLVRCLTCRPLCPCRMRSVKRCTFELGGSKAGQRCDAPLCQKCAHPHGQGLAPGVCHAHAPEAETWDPVLVPRRTS